MTVKTVPVGVLATNCYLLSDGQGHAVLVDPAFETEKIRAALNGDAVQAIVLTHGHFDHICESDRLRDLYGCPVYAAEQEKPVFETYLLYSAGGLFPKNRPCSHTVDVWLHDGERVNFCGTDFDVRVLAGHTPGGLVLIGGGRMFCGDLLFRGSIGRTDFPGGDPRAMDDSLRILASYPPETEVFPGHDAPTSIGRERRENYYLRSLL